MTSELREGTYQLGDGRSVYYCDQETLRDVADLYTVLAEQYEASGSPNVENGQVRAMLERLQHGHTIGDVYVGRLLELLKKYKDDIASLRAKPDRDGQDLLAMPSDGPDSRIIDGGAS